MGDFSVLLKNFVVSSPQQKKFKCSYGQPLTELNPDCRCMIAIFVYQGSLISDLINAKIILYRILEILVQALGDRDRIR